MFYKIKINYVYTTTLKLQIFSLLKRLTDIAEVTPSC